MRYLHLAVISCLVLAGAPAEAQVYRWTDGDGNVHYGDRPPGAGQDSDSLDLAPAPGRDSDHAARSLKRRRLLDAFEAERAEREQAEADAAEARRVQAARCDRARRTLASFERAGLLFTTDENGQRVYLSDEQRRRALTDARSWIAENCD